MSMTCGNCVHYDEGRCGAPVAMWLNRPGDPHLTTGDTDASVCEAWEWNEGEREKLARIDAGDGKS